MFIGHYGVAFAAKAADPSLPLAALMISTQLLDVAWTGLVLAGVEKVRLRRGFTATNDLDLYYMPYSHGLPAALGWSAITGAASYVFIPGLTIASAALMASVCFSHWLLDLLVHTRDLPLFGDRYKIGFGLWNRRTLTLAIELGLFAAGAAFYMTSLPPGTNVPWWTALLLGVTLAGLHITSLFGPPPRSIPAFAGSALGAYCVVAAISFAGESGLTWVM